MTSLGLPVLDRNFLDTLDDLSDDLTKAISHELLQHVVIANAHWHKDGFRVGHNRHPFQCFDSGLQSESGGGEVGYCCTYI